LRTAADGGTHWASAAPPGRTANSISPSRNHATPYRTAVSLPAQTSAPKGEQIVP
jgi:hypothetical protein